jgi:hypothetical protein
MSACLWERERETADVGEYDGPFERAAPIVARRKREIRILSFIVVLVLLLHYKKCAQAEICLC